MNKNKQRGKRFENKIADIIRKCWNLKRDECHRAQSSGTFKSDYSDIIIRPFEYKLPHIIIECKYRKNLTPNKLLQPGNVLDSFYKQVSDASIKYMSEYDVAPLCSVVYASPNMYPIMSITEDDFVNLQQNSEQYNLTFHSNIDKLSLLIRVKTDKSIFIQMLTSEVFGLLIKPIKK